MSNEYIIETSNLSKSFGRKKVLDNLNLQVKKGTIYGYLGRNGVGKTTTIKILMGLISANSGSASVFGLSPETDYVKIREKIGYVSEDRSIYKWMKVKDVCRFLKSFYPNWDDELVKQYIKKYQLDPVSKVSDLSRGTLGKLFLAMALSHHPELLILDEPTAALDPIVRGEFLEGLIDLAQQEGKTIFLATNNLNDVERIADSVGIIDNGSLSLFMEMDELKQKIRKIKLTFVNSSPKINIPGILKEHWAGNEVVLIVKDYNENMKNQLNKFNPKNISFLDISLEEIFVEYLREEE